MIIRVNCKHLMPNGIKCSIKNKDIKPSFFGLIKPTCILIEGHLTCKWQELKYGRTRPNHKTKPVTE